MKKRLIFSSAVFFVFIIGGQTAPAFAEADFFGVKMKSEDFARDIVLQENNLIPDFSNDRPGTDKRIYAYGYTSTFLGRGRGMSIQVFNHSDKDISTERLFRECTLITRDGRRYERSNPEMEWRRDVLPAGQDAVFNVVFPGLDLRRADVQMIVFSFGLGETKIFLFPLTPPKAQPAPPPAPKKAKKPKPVLLEKKPEEKKTAPAAQNNKAESKKTEPVSKPAQEKAETGKANPWISGCITPVKVVQGFFRSLSGQKAPSAETGKAAACCESPSEPAASPPPKPVQDAVAVPEKQPETVSQDKEVVEDNERTPFYPLVKSSQVIGETRYNFRPDFKETVKTGEADTQETVYQERPWSLDNPDQLWKRTEAYRVKPESPRATAEVVIVNPAYGFIVINAGLVDGVAANSIVSVLRNGRRVGKVMVTKVRDKISAAVILPEWRTKDAIEVGDLVALQS